MCPGSNLHCWVANINKCTLLLALSSGVQQLASKKKVGGIFGCLVIQWVFFKSAFKFFLINLKIKLFNYIFSEHGNEMCEAEGEKSNFHEIFFYFTLKNYALKSAATILHHIYFKLQCIY